MIREASSHRRSTNYSQVRRFREFLVSPTEIVGRANQIHARLQGTQLTSTMTTFTGESGKELPHRAIQPLNESGVEHTSSDRLFQKKLSLSVAAMRHLAYDLNHPFFLRPLDHRANMQVGPDLQTRTPSPRGILHLLTKCSPDTVWVG